MVAAVPWHDFASRHRLSPARKNFEADETAVLSSP